MTLYSERLLVATYSGGWLAISIPTGTRAVLRAIDIHNSGSAAGEVHLNLNAATVFFWELPATPTVHHTDTRLVAYEGETFSTYVSAEGIWMSASGYIFTDTVGRRSPPAYELDEAPDLPLT